MESKRLDLIVMNDATEEGAGFGVDTNRVTLIGPAGKEEPLELMSKIDLAEILLDRVEEKLNGR
jgi:phosphopantothenoylcysteine decarboxylase/phosphopantothenate--cysteine ligase